MKQPPEPAAPISASIGSRLSELHDQFDRSFTRPRSQVDTLVHNLLVIEAGSTHFALRLAEVGGLHACPQVTPLPSARPALLGLVGVRGQLLCVYRLATLLALGPPAPLPRWLLICKADAQLALAIDSIDAYVHVPESALCPSPTPASILDRFCPQTLTLHGASRPVLSLAAVISAIVREAAPAREPSLKEP